MKIINLICIVAVSILSAGCSGSNIPGEYIGTLPAADTSGMEIRLLLNPDYTFKLRTIYGEHLSDSFEDDGVYKIDKRGTITLKYAGDGIRYLKQVKNGDLRVLTINKKEVTGPMKDYYILQKQTNLYF